MWYSCLSDASLNCLLLYCVQAYMHWRCLSSTAQHWPHGHPLHLRAAPCGGMGCVEIGYREWRASKNGVDASTQQRLKRLFFCILHPKQSRPPRIHQTTRIRGSILTKFPSSFWRIATLFPRFMDIPRPSCYNTSIKVDLILRQNTSPRSCERTTKG